MRRPPAISDLPQECDAATFWDLFGRDEHTQLDFKRKPDGLDEVMVAMAMTDGGLVVVGVSDQREFLGCPLDQRTLDKITEKAHQIGVDVNPRSLTVGDAELTVIGVPEVRERIVTTPEGRLLRRRGSSNRALVGEALARFVREREGRSAEEETVPFGAIDDLELDLVNRVLGEIGRPRTRRDGLLRALVDLGLTRSEGPPTGPAITKAAVLLFAREPRRYVPGAVVQLVRRAGVGPGMTPTTARVELSRPLPRLVDEVVAFIESNSPAYSAVVGTRREALPAYPRPAVREAVLNALAHRDYSLGGATVDVTVWDDRMEIHSPGPLPGHITVENIREEHYSRNRRVMAVLKQLRLVEEYGEGIDRIFREMEARLMEPPTIHASSGSVTLTLHTRSLITVEDQAWLSLVGHLGLTAAERRVLVLARRDGAVTPRRIRALMPEADEEALLTGATAKGLLVRVGERGGTRYVLSDEVVLRAGASGLEARGRQRQMLLDEVRRRGSLSAPEAADLLDESIHIVRHLLNDLARRGDVVAEGRTRARRYYVPESVGRRQSP